ncbi:MAG: DUF2726 domain-containing protein [Clostridia bacterium]|nr:DUF2726 domain-containing protein [Clostridia bacterium]
MQNLILVLSIILILGILIKLSEMYTKKRKKEYKFNGKLNDVILTYNERKYYHSLRKLLENTEYIIFSKVRLADIIKTYSNKHLNKVSGKHIDFLITDKNTKPLLFIELDDSTHERAKNKENDVKKNYILSRVGIEIMRTDINHIENNLLEIKNKLKIV